MTMTTPLSAVSARVRPSRRWHTLPTPSGPRSARQWARSMLSPGAAVILDTETTSFTGAIVEIAVLDASTGETLLHSLINPQEAIETSATAVHGLTDQDVADAPLWCEVLPHLVDVTRGRQILAYNADFDRGRVADANRGTPRTAAAAADLTSGDRWECLMLARSAWLATPRLLRLDGPHRALADTRAARQLLIDMTSRRRQITCLVAHRISHARRRIDRLVRHHTQNRHRTL